MLDGPEAIGVARCSRDGRDWHHQGVVPVDLQGCAPDGVFPFHGFQHGLLKQVPPLHRTLWGWRGVRVGEASNPGPVQTRSGRRLFESLQDTVQENVRVDVSTARRRRRRLRALPWSWDSDSEPDETAQTRQARRSQRSCPITQVDAPSDEEVLVRSNRGRRVVPRTDGELPATVPASPGALFAAGFLPEVETSGTQHSRRHVLSVPEDVVGALESDLTVEDLDGPVEVFAMTDEAPEEFQGRPVMGRRVVLVPQSADGTPRSHFNVSKSVEADEVSTLPEVGFTAPESVAGQASVRLVMGSEVAGRFPVAELESGHQSGPPFSTGPNQSRTSDTESVVTEESEIADDDSRTSPEGEDLVMSQPRGAHLIGGS